MLYILQGAVHSSRCAARVYEEIAISRQRMCVHGVTLSHEHWTRP